MFQRLLICTDFTDCLQRFVNFVPSLAAGGVKHIVFLHVIPLSEDRAIPRIDEAKTQEARDRLTVAHQLIPEGVDVRVEVQWGKPVDMILNMVKAHHPDLIVLGTPIRSLLTEKLFGSTTLGLSQRTKTPLLIFRPQLLCTYTTEELDLRCRHIFRHFLLPYDGSQAAHFLIEQVKRLAHDRPPETLKQATLCWVIEEGGRRDVPKPDRTQAAKTQLEEVKPTLEALNIQVTIDIRQGEPVPQVIEAANFYDISAIAFSSDSLGTFLEWSGPCFAGEILRRSWHPVIYFAPPD